MNTPLPSKLRTFHSLLRALACMAFIIVLSPVQAPGAVQGTVVAWGGYGDGGETNVPSDLRCVVAIAAGVYHTVALKQDGKVVVWGSNSGGQTNVPAGLSNVVAIAAGGGHVVALKQDTTVVSWGDNYYGQTNVPVGLSNVVAIAAGGEYSVALRGDGKVTAWGLNNFGQTRVPAGLSNVVAISAGGNHTLVLKNDGHMVAWGYNGNGQTNVPVGLSSVVAVAAGLSHSLALQQGGAVVAWGKNDYGQTSLPGGLSSVIAITAGGYHSLALKQDGAVVAWGRNDFGQATVPAGLSNVTAIAAGGVHTVVVGGLFPRITAQPASLTVSAGQNITLNVTAIGSPPLCYQWRKDSIDIPGATDASYTFPAVADTDEANYSVVVVNSGGSVTSAVASLTVLDTPVFAVEPSSQIAGVGSNVTFSAMAYGTPPLVFQWYFNDSPIGSPTVGTNITSHTLTNVQTNKSGTYSVRVFNGYGSATSAGAALNVVVFPPTIAIQPSSQNPLLGHVASFTVSVIGTPPFQYQWQFNGSDIPGATNVAYSIPSVTASDTGNYAVVVANSMESVRSDDAALTVVVPPTLGLQRLAGYPLLSLNGMLGSNFNVQFISNLPASNWLNLRSISNLSVNPYQFLDTGGSTQPVRYYRAVMQ